MVSHTGRWMLSFQSTLPMRGATMPRAWSTQAGANFNPRSPCGERHAQGVEYAGRGKFQSTLPMRGATPQYVPQGGRSCYISIHAPHAGSDQNVGCC